MKLSQSSSACFFCDQRFLHDL